MILAKIAFTGLKINPRVPVTDAPYHHNRLQIGHETGQPCGFWNAKRMDATLRNIYNLVNYYTTISIDYDVRVVSNSAGVQFMITDTKGTKFAGNTIDEKTAKPIHIR